MTQWSCVVCGKPLVYEIAICDRCMNRGGHRPAPRSHYLALALLALGVAALVAATASSAQAQRIPVGTLQCSAGPLVQFAPPGPPEGYGPARKFKAGYATSFDLFTYQGARSLLVRENYGFTTYSLANPAQPTGARHCDLESTPGYRKVGDMFTTVYNVAAAPDGTRILVAYYEPHGNLVMGRQFGAPGCEFNFGGEFPPNRASGGTIALSGGRYLAFSTYAANISAPVNVADVTTLLSGAAAQKPKSIPSQGITGVPGSVGESGFVRGARFIYHGRESVVVVGFGAALASDVYPAASFGFPAGSQIANVAAETHPNNGKLYLLVEGLNPATLRSEGYALATLSGSFLTIIKRIPAPAAWPGTGATTALALSGDVLFVTWRNDQGTPMRQKFSVYAASDPGRDLTPAAVYARDVYPDMWQAWQTKALSTGRGRAQLYIAAGGGAYTLPLTCTRPLSKAPATKRARRNT